MTMLTLHLSCMYVRISWVIAEGVLLRHCSSHRPLRIPLFEIESQVRCNDEPERCSQLLVTAREASTVADITNEQGPLASEEKRPY
jgi:hypothetical protein